MITWLECLLYSAPFPNGEALRQIAADFEPSLVIDFREPDKSQWFARYLPEDAEIVSHPVKSGEVYLDVKRVSKDKNATAKKLCRRIVEHMHKKRGAVVIFCPEGNEYLAMVCKHWYRVSRGDAKWDDDYMQGQRYKHKPQVAQMKDIIEYAKGIVKWNTYL